MKKGRMLLNTSLPRTARLSLLAHFAKDTPLSDADVLYVRAAELADMPLRPSEVTQVKGTLRRGHLRLLPLSPVPPLWEEELFLRELFLAEDVSREYGTRPSSPLLSREPSASLCELLSHFGYEEAFLLTKGELLSESLTCTAPDGATLSVMPLSVTVQEDGAAVFSLPQRRGTGKKPHEQKSGEADRAEKLDAPFLPRTYREAALEAEKRALADLFFRRVEPLCAALSATGHPQAERAFLTDALLFALADPSPQSLRSVREELLLFAERAMRLAEDTGLSAPEEEAQNDGARNDGAQNDGARNDGARNDGVQNDGVRNDEAPLGSLLLFHPRAYPSEETVTATVTLPLQGAGGGLSGLSAARAFALRREDGRLISADTVDSTVTAEGELAYTIRFKSGMLPPLSFVRYSLLSEQTGPRKAQKTENAVLENKHYRIAFSAGELLLTVKSTGRVLKDPFFLEDQGSRREGAFAPTSEGSLLAYPDATCRLVGTNAQTMELSFSMELPVSYDFTEDERSLTVQPLTLTLDLSFAGTDGELLSVGYRLADPAAHHRLRLAVRSGRMAEKITCASGRHFFCARGGELPAAALYAHTDAETHFAAYPACEMGAEWVNDALYLTLIQTDRRVGGTQSGCFALSYGSPLTHAELRKYADHVAAAPFVSFFPESKAEKSATPCVANPLSDFAYQGEDVHLCAIKPAEDGDGIILRFASFAEDERYLRLHAEVDMHLTTLREEGELPLDGRDVRLRLSPLQSLTIRLASRKRIGGGEPPTQV